MAGLSQDCFAHGGALLPVEEAAALLLARVVPLSGTETLPLRAARGRILAEPLIAPHDLPPFRNSAVDGYAFRLADRPPDGWMPLAARIAAGQAAAPLPPGSAARVFTGAPVPEGADTIAMQENTTALPGQAPATVCLPPGLAAGANIRPAAEDIARGEQALPAGHRLDAAAIGLAAALGRATLSLTRRPVVGVFSTGDELVEPGHPLRPAQAHDSNRHTLLALLDTLPVEARDLGILPDRAAATADALRHAASRHDLLLTSGGISAGEEDHVRAAIQALGTLHFWKLAVKPGKPAAMGVVGGTPVVGLPGNPVAAVVAFLHLARPLALRLAGAAPSALPRYPAIAGFAHAKKPGRREYLRVSLRNGIAERQGHDGAGLIGSLARSDALLELAEHATAIEPGAPVSVIPFAGLL